MEKRVIIVSNQEELNSIKLDYDGEINIIGGSVNKPLILNKLFQFAKVILSDNASVNLASVSHVDFMMDNSYVGFMSDYSNVGCMKHNSHIGFMGDYSSVGCMIDNSHIDSMRINSKVTYMYEDSHVDYMGEYSWIMTMHNNSHVNVMRDHSCVEGMKNNSIIIRAYDNSSIINMRDRSQVNFMCGNSQIACMYDNSKVIDMHSKSQVNFMYDYSQINFMITSSHVGHMYNNSQVNYMSYNSTIDSIEQASQVKEMWGNSTVKIYSKDVKVNCFGNNYIFISNDVDNTDNVILNKTSQILRFDTFETKPNIDFYLKNYKLNKKDENTLIMYKAVHKNKETGVYFSHYDENLTYEIGKKYYSDNKIGYCDIGSYVGNLSYVFLAGWWKDFAILELEVPINKIVIPEKCFGEVIPNEIYVVKEANITHGSIII